jgi:hypothetical protein
LRGGALPPALLSAALGLALAFAPRRIWRLSLVTLAVTATALAMTAVPRGWLNGVFLGCWLSVAASAASVYWPGALGPQRAIALAFNAGFWSGAVVAVSGSRLDLLKALPCVIALFPAALIISLRAPIVVKVVSSWLIAIAVLAATLQFLPVTPGYMPDHLD